MPKFKIAGHVFDGRPSFMPLNYERGVGVVVPADTPMDVIMELQSATLLEILDEKTLETVGTHRLTGWRSIEHVNYERHQGIALVWTTINLDIVSKLEHKIETLEAENQSLTEENATLTDAILELAAIVGEEDGA